MLTRGGFWCHQVEDLQAANTTLMLRVATLARGHLFDLNECHPNIRKGRFKRAALFAESTG